MVANAASVAHKPVASVLVVDEDLQLCHALVRNLRERGYDASSVMNFEEALHCVRERHYDVLLTDLHMQGGDGMDLILALREASPGTRPVLMSADATARESQRALDLGAVRVLCKPFEVDEMLLAVERAAEYAGGFWASVHGLSLVDTLQMLHLSRRSLSVHFLGAVRAALHMQDGHLVHAEYGELNGEVALAAILNMPAGSLQTLALEPVTQTIFRDFQTMLLDQLRQLDEKVRDSKSAERDQTFDDDFADLYAAVPAAQTTPKGPVSTQVPRDARLADDAQTVPETDVTGAPHAARGAVESGEWPAVRLKRQTIEKINVACERIVNAVDGALACALIDLESGVLLGVHDRQGSPDRYDVVAAATVELFRGTSTSPIEAIGQLEPAGAAPGQHSFEEVQLTSRHGLHFAKTLKGGSAAILLVTTRDTGLGMGWAQLRSAIPVFERLLV